MQHLPFANFPFTSITGAQLLSHASTNTTFTKHNALLIVLPNFLLPYNFHSILMQMAVASSGDDNPPLREGLREG